MDIPIFDKVTDRDVERGIISTEEMIAGLAKNAYKEHNKKVVDTYNDPDIQRIMRIKRYEADLHNSRKQEGGFAKYVGSFPNTIVQKIEEMYGPDVFRDPKVFKAVMQSDDFARSFCLVDPRRI